MRNSDTRDARMKTTKVLGLVRGNSVRGGAAEILAYGTAAVVAEEEGS